jgi:hypothetical protein
VFNKRFFLFLLFLFLSTVGVCFAADPSSDEYYQQFLKNFRVYQAENTNYQNIKSKYVTYQSVASRADFMNEAKKYLTLEIQAAQAYISLTRTRLVEVTQILNYQENLYFVKLDDEFSYLEALKGKVNEASSVSEVLELWTGFDHHFQTVSNYGYGVKIYIEIAFLEKNIENLKITKDNINQFLSEVPSENQYLKAAKDNFSLLEKQYQEIVSNFEKTKLDYNQVGFGDLDQGRSTGIHNEIDQNLTKIKLLIENYQALLTPLL